jgi:NAD(P)-dependent dehydrogenase (short-subunit alcohol dehydrogenase family)
MNSQPQFDLTGRVAIVTGASRGIGQAVAQTLAAAGAKVALASRKQESLDKVVAEIQGRGGQAIAIAAHTGETAAVRALVAQVVERWGGVDILVNNAATNPHFGPLLTADEGQWQKILDVNVVGYFRMAQAVAPEMQKRGKGKIINMASVAGVRPMPGMGVYSVSKAAVIMLTQTLAQELGPSNIQVNAIAPGVIKTRFSSVLWQTESIAKGVLASTPLGRFGEVDDLTGAALYLASSASDYMTGAVLVIDGGINVVGLASPA